MSPHPVCAVQHGLYGDDALLDYETDATADAYQEWRNAWASALMGGDEAKKDYGGKRKFYLSAMECYYKNRSATDSCYLVKGECARAGAGAFSCHVHASARIACMCRVRGGHITLLVITGMAG